MTVDSSDPLTACKEREGMMGKLSMKRGMSDIPSKRKS
jgi:hypothetical protein